MNDDIVFLIEYWCIDLDGTSIVGVHKTLSGAFKKAGLLSKEQWDEYESEDDVDLDELGWIITYDQNAQDQTVFKLTANNGTVLETWTLIPTKVED